MALIGKIREKSVLLVVIIGVALFAFILGDWRKITGASTEAIGYGTVYGEMVEPGKFEEANAKFQEQEQNQFAQQQREFTQKDQDAAADKAWNYVVENILFEKEYEALGIDVSENEFRSYLFGTDGFTVLPELAQNFTDSTTGMFNAKMLEKRIQEMEASSDAQVKKQWEESKKYYTDRRKQEKYFALVGQGLYVTKLEAEEEYFAQKEVKSVSFVVRRFSEIDDKEIRLTDSELQKYYEEHKNDKKYENRTSSRDVRYFDITVTPSKGDSAKFNREMNTLKGDFAKSTNDSLFVLKNSDNKVYTKSKLATAVPEDHPKAQQFQSYPKSMDTIFKAAKIGDIVGPYVSKENYVISKVIGFTPTRIKARHILLGTSQSKDAKLLATKKAQADSILKLLTKDNFGEYVNKFSDDQGSKAQGGVIDNFIEAEMVEEFASFCATQPIGKIGLVKSLYGYHIIEVMERDDAKLPLLASVQKVFKPSQETIDRKNTEVFNLVDKLMIKLGSKESVTDKVALFDTIAQQAGYFVRPMNIAEDNPKLYGFTTKYAEDKILKLAFNDDAQAGDLVDGPIKDKDRYIIAMVSAIKTKGVPNFEDVKEAMKRDLLDQKKADRLMNSMKKDKTLQAMAKRGNTEVLKAEVTFANPQLSGAGYEPEIVGALFSGLKKGQRTAPLKGKMGVYVVRIDKSTKAPAAAGNYKNERDQLIQALRGNFQGQLLGALKKKAEVMDNRRFLSASIRR